MAKQTAKNNKAERHERAHLSHLDKLETVAVVPPLLGLVADRLSHALCSSCRRLPGSSTNASLGPRLTANRRP
ncbi:MAG: hypothetical protein ABSG36_17970 [Acidimicrobiales bacterium]